MSQVKDFWRQALWLSVCIVPIPAGAFAVHTPDALLVCVLSYTLLALLIPFFYFSVQRAGYGSVWGKKRCAVHLPVSSSLSVLFWMVLWFGIGKEEAFWKAAGPVLGTAAFAALLVLLLAGMLRLDGAFLSLYERLKRRSRSLAEWLALAFFTGFLPSAAAAALLFFALARLDGGMVLVFYLSTGLTWILWAKIILAMMGISFYLYFSQEGPRLNRMIQVVFTAFFWLIFLYIPIVTSLRLDAVGAWRVYADPAYLSIAPWVSDLWLTGAAYWAGKKVTAWIAAAAGEK